MAIVITLGLHTGCIGDIFITGIFGNFYTKRGGEFLTFRTGIPGDLAAKALDAWTNARPMKCRRTHHTIQTVHLSQPSDAVLKLDLFTESRQSC